MLGIGFGLWWADSVAALIISVDIVMDGVKNLSRVTRDLMDHRPTTVSKAEPLELDNTIRRALLELDWVEDADARIREEGHLISGEVYVVPRGGQASVDQVADASAVAMDVDWRLHDLVTSLVDRLERERG